MISIIIPVFNEEKIIRDLLLQLQNLKGEKEIIVVDGGSEDNTASIAEKFARVIKSKKGRAVQMNTGAKYAAGNILWFLHADSRIDLNSLLAIQKCIDDGNIAGGFSVYFYDYDFGFWNFYMKWICFTSGLRIKYLKVVFGDQGFFIRKDIFDRIGGFKEIPIMEDYEISQRVSKRGKIKLLKNKIGTSARRFTEAGILKTFLQMKKLQIRFLLTGDASDLSKSYKDIR